MQPKTLRKVAEGYYISIDEAQEMLPFTFTLPTWVPEGCRLGDKIQLLLPTPPDTSDDDKALDLAPQGMIATWVGPHNIARYFRFIAMAFPQGSKRQSYPDKEQTVDINGISAILRRVGLNQETGEVVELPGYYVGWVQGNVGYQVGDVAGHLTVDEILRIARSIPL